jgi:type IV secretion system protein TrbL
VKIINLFLFLSLIIPTQEVLAAINGQGILDDVENKFQTAALGWAAALTARASWLFWVLVLISMVWSNGLLLLRKADLTEFYSEFTRFIIFTGFFWWLLSNGPKMAHDMISSMQILGNMASGTPGSSPSSIVDVGFQVFNKVVKQSALTSPILSTSGIIMGVMVIVVLALIAANMLILLISGWILAYAGVFYLGFGGSRWTSDIAITYFKTVLNIGVQLMTMVLLVSIGQQFINDYFSQMDTNMNLNDMASMLVAAVVLLVLVNKIPPMIGQIAQGGGTGALGNGFGTGTAVAAAGVAGAAAAIANSAFVAGAANIGGGAQAVMAAANKASQNASNIDDLISRTGGVNSALDNSSSSSQSSSSSKSPLAAVMGDGAIHLASGIKQVLSDNIQARIDQTFGGKVASAIQQSEQTPLQNEKNASPVFDNNSLSGENEKSGDDSMSDEISAFRDGTDFHKQAD